MILEITECYLFFSLSRELGAGPLHFEKCSWKALIFMSFMKLNPSVITVLAVLVPGKNKHINKTSTLQMEFNPFTRVAIALCFTQVVWCSHGLPLNGIKCTEQSTASRDCYRSHTTIKFLISDYYGVHMLLFPCHFHGKYVFGDSIPTRK